MKIRNKILIGAMVMVAHSPVVAQTVTPAQVPWDSAGRLFIFGDSQSDSGSGGQLNNPGAYNGRYSNGPLWWEYAYPNKTLAVDPFLNGLVGSTSDGINFAIGGGGVAGLPAPSGNVILPGAKQQVTRYVQLVSAKTITTSNASDTFVIFSGGNNFGYAIRTGTTPDVTQMLADIRTSVDGLTGTGANRFIIVGIENSRNTTAQVQYYEGLRSLTRDLNSQGATAIYINYSTPLGEIGQNPNLYGLKEPLGNCAADGFNIQTCPSNYFLFDNNGHFTTNVHRVIGHYVAAVQNNVNYASTTYAQVINTAYQVHRNTVDVLSSNAQRQSGNDFNIYGFTRYNSGHANGQGSGERANYSGYTFGLGAYLPLNEDISAGLSGAIYDGDTRIGGLLGGSGKSEAYDVAANLSWRSRGRYATITGGAGQHKFDLTRDTSYSWRPTVQNHLTVDSVFFSLEAGANLQLGGARLTPFGRVDYKNFDLGKTQETGALLTADVSATALNSWQISGGLKAEVPLSNEVRLGVTGSVSKDLAGTSDITALFDNINYSRANLDMGNGVEAKGAVDLSGRIWKSVYANLEVGGRTGKLASDGYVQVGLTVPF